MFKAINVYFVGLVLIVASGCSDDERPGGTGGYILRNTSAGSSATGSISNGGASAIATTTSGSTFQDGNGTAAQTELDESTDGNGATAGTSGSGSISQGTAGTSGKSGTDGIAGSGGSGKTIVPARCSGDSTKTVMAGDSYLDLSGEITGFLRSYSGLSLDRTYYVNGTGMAAGLPPLIPEQYEQAKADGTIESVIMDGGGNDVLIGDLTCWIDGYQDGSSCETTVLAAMDAAKALLKEAAADGVKEVIYFFYPHIGNDVLNGVLDKALPLAKALCEDQQELDCTFIDTQDGYKPEWLEIDGIHPTTEGSEFIAKLIWDVMRNNCQDGVADYKSP